MGIAYKPGSEIDRLVKKLAADAPYSVWIDHADLSGDLRDDAPLIVAAHHGQWLLRDFIKPQPREWTRVVVL